MNITHFRAAQEALKNNPDLEIFNKEHPRSVYNLVPDYVRDSMDEVPQEYMLLSWVQLRKEIEPDIKLDQLRINFWLEYRRAQNTSTKMNMGNVYADICPASTFKDGVATKPHKLIWLLCPPIDYETGMRAIVDRGIEVMYEIVTHPNLIKDTRLLNYALRVIDKAMISIHGLPTIRTETKSVNVNLNSSTPSPTHSDIEEKRRELERLKAEREAIPVIAQEASDD